VAQKIIRSRKGGQKQLDQHFPLLTKSTFFEISERMLEHGRRVVIGRLRANPYQYQDVSFMNFKEVNDHFGSKIGDEVIQLLAYVLNKSFSRSFFLARESVPPDEFIFMAESFDISDMSRFLEAAQTLISNLAEIKVAFEVSMIDSEESDLATLDKVRRAGKNIVKITYPSGNLIKTFNRNLAGELDQEIKDMERAEARRAESSLST